MISHRLEFANPVVHNEEEAYLEKDAYINKRSWSFWRINIYSFCQSLLFAVHIKIVDLHDHRRLWYYINKYEFEW